MTLFYALSGTIKFYRTASEFVQRGTVIVMELEPGVFHVIGRIVVTIDEATYAISRYLEEKEKEQACSVDNAT